MDKTILNHSNHKIGLLKRRILNFLAEYNQVCKKAGRDPREVKILYATKYLNPIDFVSFLHIMKEIDMIPVLVGENRVQMMEGKMGYIKDVDIRLINLFYPVMIGILQKNKINKALGLFREFHAVDSIEIAKEINKRAETDSGQDGYHPVTRQARMADFKKSIFLEVNVSGETAKHGFIPKDLEDAISTIKQYNNITIKGLMTMAPYTDDLEKIRGIFRSLKEMADRYDLLTSMGMSHDWKIAVEEGSDIIRIGSRIFC